MQKPSWFANFWEIPRRAPQTQVIIAHRRVYIFPTRQGFAFLAALLVMLLGAMNYSNNMGYMMTFLLASVGIVSILHTHRMLLNLKIEAGQSSPVFAGENAHFEVWIDNQGHNARYAVKWQLRPPRPKFIQSLLSNKANLPTAHYEMSPLTIDIAANQRQKLLLTVSKTQRGWFQLPSLMIESRFPLGLFRAWSYIELQAHVLVYPAARGETVLPAGRKSSATGEGSLLAGAGEDFIGYRDYHLGDSPRHVDWKAVARGQEWLIKQFGGASSSLLIFKWSDVAHTLEQEAALSQLCLWILLAEQQGAIYSLELPNQSFDLNQGEQHRDACLKALAVF